MTYELADFAPDGHRHGCPMQDCGECVQHLYAIAQDTEQALAQVRALCDDEWDALSKGETGTTARIRKALTVEHWPVGCRCTLDGETGVRRTHGCPHHDERITTP